MIFKSLVVIDLETTNIDNAKITELCMLAAEREHLNYNGSRQLPRVLHKLSLCVNPCRKINPVASALTGLDNELLCNLEPINGNLVDAVVAFLRRVPPPFCLVAHNGFKFDFPILRRELGIQHQLEDLLIVDSLDAFRDIFNRKRPPVSAFGAGVAHVHTDTACLLSQQSLATLTASIPRPISKPVSISPGGTATPAHNSIYVSQPIHPLLMDEEEDAICLQALLDYESSLEKESYSPFLPSSMEFTPPVKPLPQEPAFPHKRMRYEETHPHSQEAITARRLLKFDNMDDGGGAAEPELPDRPASFKLEDIYEHLMQRPMMASHRAEADCQALIQCVACVKDQFFNYAENNYRKFSTLK